MRGGGWSKDVGHCPVCSYTGFPADEHYHPAYLGAQRERPLVRKENAPRDSFLFVFKGDFCPQHRDRASGAMSPGKNIFL